MATPDSTGQPGRVRRGALQMLAAGAALLTVVSCGSSGGGSSTSSSSSGAASSSGGGSSSGDATAAGVQHAKDQLAKYAQTPQAFTAPGPAVANVSSLKGKTIYYIPIALQVPFFHVVIQGLQDALGKVGITLRVCDGAANPSATAGCLNQAAAENAAGVVTDSLPVEFAANAFQALKDKHIPVVLANEPYPDTPGDKSLAYLSYDGPSMLALTADWVIADSNGSAEVLINEISDSIATTIAIDKGALPEFQQYCPNCKVHVNKATTANFGQIPGLTSTAYVQNPNINYAIPQFDSTVPPTQSGLQQAGANGKVKGATSTGTLSGLQMIKANNFIFEDTGFDMYREGWLMADQVLRMATGADPVQKEQIPLRVFTSDNVSQLTVDNNSFQSGAWYGNADYKNVLLQLWGAS